MINFLSAPLGKFSKRFSRVVLSLAALHCGAVSAVEDLERQELKFGFIKLTDCAPLIVAYEKGFFEEEGLYVTLEAQANWKVLLDRVIDGSLDGSHMLPGQPLGAAAGIGTQAALVTPFAMGLNTLAITVSNEVWASMKPALPLADGAVSHPIKADALKPVVEGFTSAGKKFNMAMVFPTSTHNYLLRYWLAAGGIAPGYYSASDITGQTDGDVLLSVTPPPQMPATLESGTINGYSVGEPWNQQAVFKGIGVPVITANEIWSLTPEKVFGLRADFVAENPNTTRAIVKALIRAAVWLDAEGNANRQELAEILSRPDYVGADIGVIQGPITGQYQYEKGDVRPSPTFNLYFQHGASYPFYSDAVWFLSQMRRWGQIAEAKPDTWYFDTARKVYRPELYRAAAEELIAEGVLQATDLPGGDGYKAPTSEFIDGIEYDGKQPTAYLAKFAIGQKD
jgi:nitrate/nitrite transport system substrate-binding protein